MWMIKINGLPIPVYYQYIKQAYAAAAEAKAKYIACRIEIVPVQTNYPYSPSGSAKSSYNSLRK